MTILAFITNVGAPEGGLLTTFKQQKEEVLFFHTRKREFYPESIEEVPTWLNNGFIASEHILAQRYFARIIEKYKIRFVVATGLEASEYACSVIQTLPVHPFMFPGDLDFGPKSQIKMQQARKLFDQATHLYLADRWEMLKAVSRGSRLPHFKYPLDIKPGSAILSTKPDDKRVALIHPPLGSGDRLEPILEQYEQELGKIGYQGVRIDARSLYTSADLQIGRSFPGTMCYRIKNCIAAVIFGESRHHAHVFAGLAQSSDAVFIEDRINSAEIYKNSTFANYGRGAALLVKVLRFLESNSVSKKATSFVTSASLTKTLEYCNPSQSAFYYEDLDFPPDSPYFDIFFSVAPIENRTNGARFQRIRNMSAEFGKNYPTIWLTSNDNMIARRFALIQSLVKRGMKPRYFYGENSTSPMSSYSEILSVANVIRYLRQHGASAGWFVRDLHWLFSSQGMADEETATDPALIGRGIFELEQMAMACGTLFAPDDASIVWFKKALGHRVQNVTWIALPPGVSESNVLSPHLEKNSGPLTLVYSGGIGGMYVMDTYLDALCKVPSHLVRLDFIVRAEDVADLQQMLSVRQLDSSLEITIYTSSFEDYIPRPNSVGIILLDSDYAKFSFPYKTISIVEKGLPIITYEDMAIAGFVRDEEIGVIAKRSVAGVVEAILHLASEPEWPSLHQIARAQKTHSWLSRVDFIHSALRPTMPQSTRLPQEELVSD